MEDCRLGGSTFELDGRVVDVWAIRTKASSAVAAQVERILAPDEKCRAEQFRFDQIRDSFIVSRGALRILLGCYLDIHAADIQFQYSSKGKPSIAECGRIEFNVSHSTSVAVFAFTRGCSIGIDVERFRTLPDMQAIANDFFCSAETAELMALPPEQREHAFFLCWTRKEAYVKATGDGLSASLDSFRVSLQPGRSASLIHLAHDMHGAKAWTLNDLRLACDLAAAVAYGDRQRPLRVKPVVEFAELLTLL